MKLQFCFHSVFDVAQSEGTIERCLSNSFKEFRFISKVLFPDNQQDEVCSVAAEAMYSCCFYLDL